MVDGGLETIGNVAIQQSNHTASGGAREKEERELRANSRDRSHLSVTFRTSTTSRGDFEQVNELLLKVADF